VGKFEAAARAGSERGLIGELHYFLSTTKKWWLLPIVVAMFGLGLLVFLSGTAAAPFIYTLF
jgi:hypothetical protein